MERVGKSHLLLLPLYLDFLFISHSHTCWLLFLRAIELLLPSSPFSPLFCDLMGAFQGLPDPIVVPDKYCWAHPWSLWHFYLSGCSFPMSLVGSSFPSDLLNVGYPQGFVFSPFFLLICTLPELHLLSVCGILRNLHFLPCFSEFQITLPSCLLDISIWICPRLLIFNMLKIVHFILPLFSFSVNGVPSSVRQARDLRLLTYWRDY